ncbi:MAG: hypothetical protein ACFCVA_11090 [Gammaproteobacteria bacterium]
MQSVDPETIRNAVAKLNQQLSLTARQRQLPEPLAAAHRAIVRSLAEWGRSLNGEELATMVDAENAIGALRPRGRRDPRPRPA